MIRIILTAIIGLSAISFTLYAQSATGVWKTIDDNTNEAKSHIEIFDDDGILKGKIVKLLLSPDDKLCDQCPGNKKDKPLLGMTIIEDLKAHEDYWKGGTILDPESGKEYKCSIWLKEGENDVLKVRGKHWTGLYRTQTWYRIR